MLLATHAQAPQALSGAGDGLLLVHNVEEGRLLYGVGANQASQQSTMLRLTDLLTDVEWVQTRQLTEWS